ncbi:lysozyme inhibitor LprI family protein [Xanthomonas sp. 3075]|uniref:lysozyme inhibitor LprI family protein n=1 Tax=Xanthomonas sp. 3075 TaxID=3035315 RepID=UPI00161F8877|nr:lysozyme inhibitor LprI family protein [Xanthomonas sp. 3075]MBB4131887.1 uncharacterized protein YecT (DUF1311 family) [Xanthomonas sp. 3075]
MFNFLKIMYFLTAGVIFILLCACKQEVVPEAVAGLPSQPQNSKLGVTKGVSQTGNSEEITRDQQRVAREQDELLEKALNNDAQQQRGELAKAVKLRSSYAQCVKDSDAVMPALMDCNNEEYEYQDARLNRAYSRLLDNLSAGDKAALKQEERDWIKKRDALCQSGGSLGGGQAEELEDSSCELNATAKRAEELENR